ncbi:hypothetical protein HYR99_25135 [Candidatus Poribacteria bacterium]|nr:hypothetical protein [Candidatus Poribacteria bacterium]
MRGWVVLCLLLVLSANAASAQYPDGVRFIKAFQISGGSNNNILVGKQTLFLNAPQRDFVSNAQAKLGFQTTVAGTSQQLTGSYQFDLSRFAELPNWNGRTQALHLTFERSAESRGEVTSSLLQLRGNFQSYDQNNDEYSFLQYQIGAHLKRFLPKGFLVELDYDFKRGDFLSDTNKDTYYNITSNTHRLQARVKLWHSTRARSHLRYQLALPRYAGNLSDLLEGLSGLTRGQIRRDWTHSLLWEWRYLPSTRAPFSIGYQFQNNRSNSPYYRYRAHQVGLVSIVNFRFKGENRLIVKGEWGFFDYYQRRFDSRYLNTRKDWRIGVNLTYDRPLIRLLTLEVKYSLIDNNSNDTIDFNPDTSISFSSFSQSLAQIALKTNF